MSTHLLDVKVKGVKNFYQNEFYVNFRNAKRVHSEELEEKIVTHISGSNYRNNLMAFAGINASGKTTALRLLDYILTVFISGDSLNNGHDIIELFMEKISLEMKFITNSNEVYKIDAKIKRNKKQLTFIEEIIKLKTINNFETKSTLIDFSEYEQEFIRTKLETSKSQFLKNDDSFFPAIRVDEEDLSNDFIINTFDTTDLNLLSMSSNLDSGFITYLDNSIEEFYPLSIDEVDSHNYPMFKIKFVDEEPIESTLFNLKKYLSSGTIKGLSVLNHVVIVMQNGGYLIIDEIENHLNKIIVENIIELFQSSLNINGATLLFSTHYSEILDRIPRTDSIQVLQRKGGKSTVNRFSTLAAEYNKDRTDIKNSDLVLSGIFGTAPSYNSYKKVRQLFKEELGLD